MTYSGVVETVRRVLKEEFDNIKEDYMDIFGGETVFIIESNTIEEPEIAVWVNHVHGTIDVCVPLSKVMLAEEPPEDIGSVDEFDNAWDVILDFERKYPSTKTLKVGDWRIYLGHDDDDRLYDNVGNQWKGAVLYATVQFKATETLYSDYVKFLTSPMASNLIWGIFRLVEGDEEIDKVLESIQTLEDMASAIQCY